MMMDFLIVGVVGLVMVKVVVCLCCSVLVMIDCVVLRYVSFLGVNGLCWFVCYRLRKV